VNVKINELLKDKGTCIDAFYFCPFHPDNDPPKKQFVETVTAHDT